MSGRPDAAARRIGPGAATVLTILFAAAAGLMAWHGVTTDLYPPFLPGEQVTSITRYSGPWLTGAAVALLASGVSAMAAVAGFRARAVTTHGLDGR